MGQGVGDQLAVAGRGVVAGISPKVNVQRIVKNDPLAAGQRLRGSVVLLDILRREKVVFIIGEKAL